ncbi:adenylate kinase family protein [Kitasatospora sp. NPDC056446]|uniref:adenylate kinase family protein n=1 Tax=Kitasatospora sp. NPDC056446 TaxID=3345819 RepID=UPI00369C550F
MRVVLFRPPVFGRESPADSLAGALGVPQVRFGDLMRTHLSRGTALGIRAAGIIASGGPFPDGLFTEVVRDHLRRSAHAGFLFVGHPHSAARALALDGVLRELGEPLDSVLHLRLPQAQAARHTHRDDRARRRIESHEAMLEPVTRYYAGQGLLVTVDAVGTSDDMTGRALTALREHSRRPRPGTGAS